MTEPDFAGIKVIPAATVVIFRRAAAGGPPELLMLRRAEKMRFAGGAAVFPGGRIDESDRELARRLGLDDAELTAARIAGVRETLEEAGLLIGIDRSVSADEARSARALLLDEGSLAPVLERHGWELMLDRLVPFARWCPRWDGAFDTRFFLADLGTGAVDIAVDATENAELFWSSAANTLALADAGELSVIFPTRRNLERLAQFASFAEATAHAQSTPIRTISPSREERDGALHLTIPEGLGYPVTSQRMDTVKRG